MMSAFILFGAVAADTAAVTHSIDWVGLLRNVGTIISMVTGLFFVMAGTIGVLRLPDFFTRLHAAGMTDTLGAELILIALIFQSDSLQMVLKLLLVAFFLLITSPTATHAIAHAAYKAGVKPVLGKYSLPDVEEDGT
ncbi:monovalent cation/H(+) antiporter subunit G [Litorimonas sp. WD9-15]|uniref:monovalent cation/H(+) antiporter subunit G n=1 Tax=Litorimonas sp. WD9-15 TaxID=3418716 RepID=UPI003D086520